jgi:chromosome segregation ATPase
MKLRLLTVAAAAALMLAAAPLRAEDEDADLKAAKQDLQSAQGHLKAATHEYGGHRKDALELVNKAVAQVNQGLSVAERRDTKNEKKVQQLEKKQQGLENKIDKLKQP